MKIKAILNIVELRTKWVSTASYLQALGLALFLKAHISPVSALLLFFAGLFLDMATTGFNTWFDYWRGTDNKAYNREPDKVLIHGSYNPNSALIISTVCFFTAGILGLLLLIFNGLWILVPGILSFIVGFMYSGGPKPISRGPFGELWAGGFLGIVYFWIALRVFGLELNQICLWAVPQGFLVAALLAFNNACDRKADWVAGRKTFAVLLGDRFAKFYPLILSVLGLGFYLGLLIINKRPWPVYILFGVQTIFSGLIFWKMFKQGMNAHTKPFIMKKALLLIIAHTLSFLVSLGLSAVL